MTPLGEAARAARLAWCDALGSRNVIVDSDALARRESATFATTARIPALLRPGSTAEVQDCLRIANRHRIPLYPVSSGRNWGYGSSVPSADGCVLLDLSRMDRIVDFDERLAYVTLEPGVTQQQLSDFLRAQGGRLWMDATGSSPQCSVVGNALERGFGHTPYGDHFNHACGLQVVLPDGDVVETGFGQYGALPSAPVYRNGVGPALDGLFAQSSFGVVTRMTVWLMPAPEHFEAFFFVAHEDVRLEPIVDALRQLRLEASLRSAVHLANDYKVLTSLGQYPWEASGGVTPLPAAVLGELSRRYDFGAWNGSGALYGTRAQVAASHKRLVALLRPHVDRLRFLDERRLSLAARLRGPVRRIAGFDLGALLALVTPVYRLMQGEPTDRMLASTYWRKRMPVPPDPDPDRDRCGLIWCAPVAPADSDSVRQMVEIVRQVFARHPFEPAMSMTLRTERGMDNVVSITYDRDVPGEDQRAMQCHDELLARLVAAGFLPYRLGVHSQGKLPPRKPGSQALLDRIKDAVDPNGILAPGRYL